MRFVKNSIQFSVPYGVIPDFPFPANTDEFTATKKLPPEPSENLVGNYLLLTFLYERITLVSLKFFCFFSFKKRREKPSLFFFSQDLCTEGGELFVEIFIAAVDELDVVHIGGSAGG